MSLTPGMHLPVPMNSRVQVPFHYLNKVATGTVVGISSCTVLFTYIVLLDEPAQSEFGQIRALSVSGYELTSEDGLSDWKLKP